MRRPGISFIIFVCYLLVTTTVLVWGAEKIRFGDSVKFSPTGRIPFEAAQEKGFWAKNGLEAENVPFGGGQAKEDQANKGQKLGWPGSPSPGAQC